MFSIVLNTWIFFLIILQVNFASGDLYSRIEAGQTTFLFKYTLHGEVWGHYKLHVQLSDIKHNYVF